MYRNDYYGPIDKFCSKHPRFGIPNLMLCIAIGQAAVGLLSLFTNGMFISLFMFSGPAILRGRSGGCSPLCWCPRRTIPFTCC